MNNMLGKVDWRIFYGWEDVHDHEVKINERHKIVSTCSYSTLLLKRYIYLDMHIQKTKRNYRKSIVKVKGTESRSTLCNPMDYTVHGILQARILEWVAFPSSKGSSQPRDGIRVYHIAGAFFTSWATREAQFNTNMK